ncbi:MAG TPA: hypothetical protein VFY81_09025, partial [Gammaproteobacteria bacterium]|nr:hypothetical protein [Gammaproteobacteria bacterium]
MQAPDNMTPCGPAARLNQQCFCLTLDRAVLERSLRDQLDEAELEHLLTDEHRHLFAEAPLFVLQADVERMHWVVQSIEAAARLPGYRQAVLGWASATASFNPGPIGALMGYDFHLTASGPRLIEVNTNAGGAFINTLLARAQSACCPETVRAPRTRAQLEAFEDAVVRMFEREWQRQRGEGRPESVAIVDDRPEAQYLYPEFRLAQQVMQAHGIKT